jgi:hypothetical protein
MSAETTIPVLPCGPLPPLIAFYELLGFEVRHKQTAPYVYLALSRGEIALHFHGRQDEGGAQAAGTCLWIVPEVEPLHRAFAHGAAGSLRQARSREEGPVSRLARATRTAAHRRDFKNDDLQAAELLDAALGRDEPAPPIDRGRALLVRAELAVGLGDPALARKLRGEYEALPLEEADRVLLAPELEALEEAERSQA